MAALVLIAAPVPEVIGDAGGVVGIELGLVVNSGEGVVPTELGLDVESGGGIVEEVSSLVEDELEVGGSANTISGEYG